MQHIIVQACFSQGYPTDEVIMLLSALFDVFAIDVFGPFPTSKNCTKCCGAALLPFVHPSGFSVGRRPLCGPDGFIPVPPRQRIMVPCGSDLQGMRIWLFDTQLSDSVVFEKI